MDERDAFLRMIVENPDDDTPRLVFADWLEEHDEPERAEFIRLQIRLARMREDDPDFAELRSNTERLLRRHQEDWEAGLSARFSARVVGCHYERGFPRLLQWTWGGLEGLEEVLARMPTVSRLHIQGHVGTEGAQVLAGSSGLAQLTEFALYGHEIRDEGAQALASSPHLARLTRLDLGENNIGPDGMRAIAQSPYLARLTSLGLYGNHVGDTGARELAESPYLRQLTSLDLGFSALSDDGVQALANSSHLARLVTLSLRSNRIGVASANALAQSPHLADLRSLSLRGTWWRIDDEARDLLIERFGEEVVDFG